MDGLGRLGTERLRKHFKNERINVILLSNCESIQQLLSKISVLSPYIVLRDKSNIKESLCLHS